MKRGDSAAFLTPVPEGCVVYGTGDSVMYLNKARGGGGGGDCFKYDYSLAPPRATTPH